MAEELTKKESTGYSGINIEEAKKLLHEEDKYDKQLYRERIKKCTGYLKKLERIILKIDFYSFIFIFKEKRLKEKEIRRAKRAKVSVFFICSFLR